MLHPDSAVVKPQTGTRYCHMEHPRENCSKNLHEINPSAGRRSSENENDEEKAEEEGLHSPQGSGQLWQHVQAVRVPWKGHPETRLTSNQQCLQDSSCIFSVGRYSRCAARPHFCYLLFEEVVFVGFAPSF